MKERPVTVSECGEFGGDPGGVDEADTVAPRRREAMEFETLRSLTYAAEYLTGARQITRSGIVEDYIDRALNELRIAMHVVVDGEHV